LESIRFEFFQFSIISAALSKDIFHLTKVHLSTLDNALHSLSGQSTQLKKVLLKTLGDQTYFQFICFAIQKLDCIIFLGAQKVILPTCLSPFIQCHFLAKHKYHSLRTIKGAIHVNKYLNQSPKSHSIKFSIDFHKLPKHHHKNQATLRQTHHSFIDCNV